MSLSDAIDLLTQTNHTINGGEVLTGPLAIGSASDVATLYVDNLPTRSYVMQLDGVVSTTSNYLMSGLRLTNTFQAPSSTTFVNCLDCWPTIDNSTNTSNKYNV